MMPIGDGYGALDRLEQRVAALEAAQSSYAVGPLDAVSTSPDHISEQVEKLDTNLHDTPKSEPDVVLKWLWPDDDPHRLLACGLIEYQHKGAWYEDTSFPGLANAISELRKHPYGVRPDIQAALHIRLDTAIERTEAAEARVEKVSAECVDLSYKLEQVELERDMWKDRAEKAAASGTELFAEVTRLNVEREAVFNKLYCCYCCSRPLVIIDKSPKD